MFKKPIKLKVQWSRSFFGVHSMWSYLLFPNKFIGEVLSSPINGFCMQHYHVISKEEDLSLMIVTLIQSARFRPRSSTCSECLCGNGCIGTFALLSVKWYSAKSYWVSTTNSGLDLATKTSIVWVVMRQSWQLFSTIKWLQIKGIPLLALWTSWDNTKIDIFSLYRT